MAFERRAPDAILSATEQTGAVTVIDEDPDDSGTDFLTASENNVDTDCRVSFASPTGNPTAGNDLQEFKIQVREFDTGQTGTPEGRIELWEDGSLVRAGTNVNITTQDQVISFLWNATELGTADGSLVECKFVGTRSGGGPTARNTTELGAVEWNVEYSTGVTLTPSPVTAAWSVVAPTVVIGAVTISPAPVTATLSVVAPTVAAGLVTLTPAPVVAVWSVVTATIFVPGEGGVVVLKGRMEMGIRGLSL